MLAIQNFLCRTCLHSPNAEAFSSFQLFPNVPVMFAHCALTPFFHCMFKGGPPGHNINVNSTEYCIIYIYMYIIVNNDMYVYLNNYIGSPQL